MAHPYHHALSSARKWGGTAEDYLALHSWFDVMWTVNPLPTLTSRVQGVFVHDGREGHLLRQEERS